MHIHYLVHMILQRNPCHEAGDSCFGHGQQANRQAGNGYLANALASSAHATFFFNHLHSAGKLAAAMGIRREILLYLGDIAQNS